MPKPPSRALLESRVVPNGVVCRTIASAARRFRAWAHPSSDGPRRPPRRRPSDSKARPTRISAAKKRCERPPRCRPAPDPRARRLALHRRRSVSRCSPARRPTASIHRERDRMSPRPLRRRGLCGASARPVRPESCRPFRVRATAMRLVPARRDPNRKPGRESSAKFHCRARWRPRKPARLASIAAWSWPRLRTNLRAQPSPRHGPLPFDRARGNAQDLRRFLVRQAAEITHLDNTALAVVERPQPG